jgi:hypothetical protein
MKYSLSISFKNGEDLTYEKASYQFHGDFISIYFDEHTKAFLNKGKNREELDLEGFDIIVYNSNIIDNIGIKKDKEHSNEN